MDPITISLVLIALVGGVGSGLGTSLWTGLGSLVRRPFRHHQESAGQSAAQAPAPAPAVTGEQQLAALAQAPTDNARALDLAHVLVGRADADPDFRQALQAWWDQAEPIRQSIVNNGPVMNSNIVSGGTNYGQINQGVNMNITGPATPAPAPPGQPRSG